jgi:hypothetical protein
MMTRAITPPEGRIRLLAFDGGGIRGLISLEIARRLEELLRERTGRPDLVLADHFHYIAGTSTGAIIAACLSWGMPVDEVIALYVNRARNMFAKAVFWRRINEKFKREGITKTFQAVFREDDGSLALMGSPKLRTFLMIVTRNATNASTWPLTNNPNALFNNPAMAASNLNFPLWQVLRASTAAPTYFPSEVLDIRDASTGVVTRCAFEDGGITPYNNPAFLLYLKATLPEYRLGWPDGRERMSLVSIGTGQVMPRRLKFNFSILGHARSVPANLSFAISQQQDLLCRVEGECRFGAPLDLEVGDLLTRDKPDAKFLYARYNMTFTKDELTEARKESRSGITLDNLRLIGYLRELGRKYADDFVKLEHFDPE